jgi:hypothetical protein
MEGVADVFAGNDDSRAATTISQSNVNFVPRYVKLIQGSFPRPMQLFEIAAVAIVPTKGCHLAQMLASCLLSANIFDLMDSVMIQKRVLAVAFCL